MGRSKKEIGGVRREESQSRHIGKPAGLIQERVQQVGPTALWHRRRRAAPSWTVWRMLCDFYGGVLAETYFNAEYHAGELLAMTSHIKLACRELGITDLIAAVEMSQALIIDSFAGYENLVSIREPSIPSRRRHYRKPLHPHIKTDDHDLEAIFHAAVKGYGLATLPVSEDVPGALQAISCGIAETSSSREQGCKFKYVFCFIKRCQDTPTCSTTRRCFPMQP